MPLFDRLDVVIFWGIIQNGKEEMAWQQGFYLASQEEKWKMEEYFERISQE